VRRDLLMVAALTAALIAGAASFAGWSAWRERVRRAGRPAAGVTLPLGYTLDPPSRPAPTDLGQGWKIVDSPDSPKGEDQFQTETRGRLKDLE